MDFNRPNNQPSSVPHQTPSLASPSAASAPEVKVSKKHGNKLSLRDRNASGWALLLIAVVLIVFGLLWFFKVNSADEVSLVDNKEYQAVFLTNGQVYFGKLVTLNDTYAKITHVFYLQTKGSPQPKDTDSSQPQNLSLQKLGSEIHGPEDAMMINRSQISFWENLKPTGQVSKAIQQYYDKGGNSSSTSSPSKSDTQAPTSNAVAPPSVPTGSSTSKP